MKIKNKSNLRLASLFIIGFAVIIAISIYLNSAEDKIVEETTTIAETTKVETTTEEPKTTKVSESTTLTKPTTSPSTTKRITTTKPGKTTTTKPMTTKSPTNNNSSNKKSLGTFKLTAYCNCSRCCGKWAGGATASGTMPKAGRTIAVDTRVIPFGTKVIINGHTYTAEDTGSAIKGNKIDIFFDSHQAALNFGVQYAEVFRAS